MKEYQINEYQKTAKLWKLCIDLFGVPEGGRWKFEEYFPGRYYEYPKFQFAGGVDRYIAFITFPDDLDYFMFKLLI